MRVRLFIFSFVLTMGILSFIGYIMECMNSDKRIYNIQKDLNYVVGIIYELPDTIYDEYFNSNEEFNRIVNCE